MPAKALLPALPLKIALLPPIQIEAKPARDAYQSAAEEFDPAQLNLRATTLTPQLLALLAEHGHGESLLND